MHPPLAIFRFVLGLGMGGEWTTGAALIAETWPAAHRGKALGLMQSTWAIGEMIAAGVVALVLPAFGWRVVFFVGVLRPSSCSGSGGTCRSRRSGSASRVRGRGLGPAPLEP